jgi:hypothetical protein
MHLRRIMLLGAGLAAIAAGSAQACSDHTVKTAAVTAARPASARALLAWKPRAWAPAPVEANGMRVAIDPADGAYSMPAPDETPQVVVAPDDEAPVPVLHRADGSSRATLDTRFADFAVVTFGADGKPRWTCVHGSVEANKFMRAPVPARQPAPGTVWEEK